MNIHFTDKNLLKKLQEATIVKSEVGSSIYNLSDKNSDIDYLYIYKENLDNLKSFMFEHHQLQYKDKNIDHNFTNIQTFIRNTLTGDSTINIETIFSKLKDTKLDFLYQNRYKFINYNIIKSYLGLAKRDLKMYLSGIDRTSKKLTHFYRSVLFAEDLIVNKNLNVLKDNEFLRDTKFKNKNIEYIDVFKNKMDYLRSLNNKNLEQNKIQRYMDSNSLKNIDEFVKSLGYSEININYKNLFYDAMSNGIKY